MTPEELRYMLIRLVAERVGGIPLSCDELIATAEKLYDWVKNEKITTTKREQQ